MNYRILLSRTTAGQNEVGLANFCLHVYVLFAILFFSCVMRVPSGAAGSEPAISFHSGFVFFFNLEIDFVLFGHFDNAILL